MYDMKSDPRFRAIYRGLDQLFNDELHRLLNHIRADGRLVCDEVNYDADSRSWCPLAVALDVPSYVNDVRLNDGLSDGVAKRLILDVGRRSRPDFSLNPIHGVPGHFFRESRRQDIENVCLQILSQRAPY